MTTEFSNLPKDILLNVFSFLSPKEKLILPSLNKTIQRQLEHEQADKLLWKSECENLKIPFLESLSKKYAWKEIFLKHASYIDIFIPSYREYNAQDENFWGILKIAQKRFFYATSIAALNSPTVSSTIKGCYQVRILAADFHTLSTEKVQGEVKHFCEQSLPADTLIGYIANNREYTFYGHTNSSFYKTESLGTALSPRLIR